MNTQFLIIDPQNDFHDQKNASLGVPGSVQDARRIGEAIKRNIKGINDIHVTLDTHQLLDVAHPIMWVDSQGRHPDPFTIISREDVSQGKWRAFNPSFQQRLEDYVVQLESNARYPLCIWPPHCLVGSWGYGLVEPVWDAVKTWETERIRRVDYVTKGHNPWTEHYSAVQADVPDASDPTTQLNTQLIKTLEQADVVFFAGQALSHCVANTVRDVANNFGPDSINKLVLIEDGSSPVPGFENLADDFLNEMKSRGMQSVKAAQIQA